jgi:hypothetical protein
MNYTELKTNIADICENSFTEDEYALFTKQAEQRIYNTVQIANLRKNMVGVMSSGNKYLAAPDDFLSVYSLAVIKPNGDYVYLLNKDVNFIREAYPNASSTGLPKHYAIFGPTTSGSSITNELTFILGPTPNSNYQVELHFYYYPVSMADTVLNPAGTTWLGDNFDSALLNATLVEAIRFMKGEPDMVQFYERMYMQSIALLKNLGDGKQRMDAYRDGQLRIEVN